MSPAKRSGSNSPASLQRCVETAPQFLPMLKRETKGEETSSSPPAANVKRILFYILYLKTRQVNANDIF